jgi:hypothetical protein
LNGSFYRRRDTQPARMLREPGNHPALCIHACRRLEHQAPHAEPPDHRSRGRSQFCGSRRSCRACKCDRPGSGGGRLGRRFRPREFSRGNSRYGELALRCRKYRQRPRFSAWSVRPRLPSFPEVGWPYRRTCHYSSSNEADWLAQLERPSATDDRSPRARGCQSGVGHRHHEDRAHRQRRDDLTRSRANFGTRDIRRAARSPRSHRRRACRTHADYNLEVRSGPHEVVLTLPGYDSTSSLFAPVSLANRRTRRASAEPSPADPGPGFGVCRRLSV